MTPGGVRLGVCLVCVCVCVCGGIVLSKEVLSGYGEKCE